MAAVFEVTILTYSLPFMNAPAFVHLRMHTEFSVTDGIIDVGAAVSKARADGQVALGMTDLMNTFGLIKFYKKARDKGIKPIIGADINIVNPEDERAPFRLLLLIQNTQGYYRLCDLITRAYVVNNQRNYAQVSAEWLLNETNDGLIALSGAQDGEIGQLLLKGKDNHAAETLQRWRAAFNNRFYLEVQRIDTAESDEQTLLAAQLAAQTHTPLVATHGIQFLNAEDHRAHEARVCIARGDILANPRRKNAFEACQYMLSQAEMQARFADLPSALANSVAIAQQCNLTLTLGKPQLPDFPTPNGESLDEYLCIASKRGLEARLEKLYPDADVRAEQAPRYHERLDIELNTIIQMGFPGYFLIVADFIQWAKDNDVPVGPGRGSGAGSLVAYALLITDLDPLAYDLLFERFLNPERVSMPDFDVDFCQDGRDRVIQYVKDTYGIESVSQIATFGTFGAKAVVRDVGRILDMPYSYCDGLSKLIPHEPTNPWTLERTFNEEPIFRERIEKEDEAQAIYQLSQSLEGLTRNIGMHAGGVLIAPGKITDFCPMYCAQGTTDVVSQYDKKDVEDIGLVKFDFLGLRNLTVLKRAVMYLKQLHPEQTAFELDQLALDDPKVFDVFTQGNTTAVFQSEARGAKELEKKLKPDCFEDVIALMALNRPGPLGSGMVDDFIQRKNQQKLKGKGEDNWYFHPKLKPVLESTFGVMVYQEQVMLVAQILAGYSLGGADLLRRAMGKKDAEEMARQRAVFVEGARTHNDVDEELATTLFNLMEKFADYGFNKSHSAAYALIAYHTAWFKCYYPAEFMAATLSLDMDYTDKIQTLYQDCVDNGLSILPPDINSSNYYFEPFLHEGESHAKTIRYGLGAVKGTGQSAVDAITNERTANGAYASFFDFCMRVDKAHVNRRTIESLIKAGAFDSLHHCRASLLASVDAALAAAAHSAEHANQNSLFDDTETLGEQWQAELQDVLEWTLREKLAHEKVALGYYLSGHLFDEYEAEARKIAPTKLANLHPSHDLVTIAGIITSVRWQNTDRGKRVFITLDDKTDRLELLIFSEEAERYAAYIKEEQLVFIQASIAPDKYTGGDALKINSKRLMDLTHARVANASNLYIDLDLRGANVHVNSNEAFDLHNFKQLLKQNWDEDGLRINLHTRVDGASADIKLGLDWTVIPTNELLAQLKKMKAVEKVVWE